MVEQGGRELREAIQAYLDATEAELGQSWLSAAAHTLRKPRKKSTQYHGASPREVLELEVTEMVAGENAEGNIKKLLSACR